MNKTLPTPVDRLPATRGEAPRAAATPDGSATPKRSRELDAVRGVAALLVVLFHYTSRYPDLFGDRNAPFEVAYGYLGVQVFFGVSGFVILMTLEHCRTPADFVVARALRLYPAYWTALLLTFAALLAFPLQGQSPTWRQGAVNLTMLQSFVQVSHVDGAYWSLEIELVFYAWMLLVFAAGWMRHARALVALWLAASIGIVAASMLLHHPVPTFVDRYLLVQFSAFFSIGAVAYLDFRDRRTARSSWGLFALAIAAARIGHSHRELLVAVAMVGLFWLISRRKAGFLDMPLLVFLGTISYPLYLLHQQMGYVIIQHARAHGITYGWALLIACGMSLVAASALSFGIERPVQRRVGRWRRSRSAAAHA